MVITKREVENILQRRSELLYTIIKSPCTKAEIVEKLDVSRSTVSRGLKSYEEKGCIEYQNGKYRATIFGKLLFEEYDRYQKRIQSLSDTAEIISTLPEATGLPSNFIHTATKHPANPEIPAKAFQSSNELLYSSDQLCGVGTYSLPAWRGAIKKAVIEKDLKAQIIIEEDLLTGLIEMEDHRIESLKGRNNITFYTTKESLPYAIWVMGSNQQSYAGVAVRENGALQGVLLNEDEEAVQWAREQYETHLKQASKAKVGNS